MKVIFFLLISFSCFSQHKQIGGDASNRLSGSKTLMYDPRIDTAQLFMAEQGDTLTVKEFQQWMYKNITAEKYSEFMQYYQAYMQSKFDAWLREKKKK